MSIDMAHAEFVGYVIGAAARAGVRLSIVTDADGNPTDTLWLDTDDWRVDIGVSLVVVVPPPPDGWTAPTPGAYRRVRRP